MCLLLGNTSRLVLSQQAEIEHLSWQCETLHTLHLSFVGKEADPALEPVSFLSNIFVTPSC